MKKLYFTIALAILLWTIMFSPITSPYINFWWMMTGSASILVAVCSIFSSNLWIRTLSSLTSSRKVFKFQIKSVSSNILLGILIAALLWSVFWLGDKLSQLMFNFARPQVDLIYGMKDGESVWLLTILMLFLIGPAEEIFWRGYVQYTLSKRWNPNIGFVVTTSIYALVHAGSCNFMLTMAALVAGFVWGILYRFFPERFAAIIISHAIWDAAVFIWFPI